MAGFAIARLTLAAFRNYGELDIRLTDEPVVLTGDNGAGKTNILEAVSLLSPGRGLRRAAYADMARHGDIRTWSIVANIRAPGGETVIGTGPKPGSSGNANRIVRIDRETASAISKLSNHIRVLWLTPAMDGLFTGPAADRRAFLDRLVLAIDPAHAGRVSTFERLMRDRNRINAEPAPDPAWLDALESQMSEVGTAIAAGRNDAVSRLCDMIAADRERDGVDLFPWARLTLVGTLEKDLENAAAIEVEDRYRAMLRESRITDRSAGRTLSGPHRSDLVVGHGPKHIEARLASTGEQKALLIGLILAHARLVAKTLAGTAPIMLLDEVAAHLDAARRTALFDRLGDLGGQAWMTGTDHAAFEPLRGRAQFATITNGTFAPDA